MPDKEEKDAKAPVKANFKEVVYFIVGTVTNYFHASKKDTVSQAQTVQAQGKNSENYISKLRALPPLTSDSPLRIAYNTALDVRKFEIELYWKRSAYFWAVIAATLGAYGAMATVSFKSVIEGPTASATVPFLYQLILLVLAGMGTVFSWGWLFVNKGSKFWQSNWEAQVDLLEDAVVGPLYKTVFSPHTAHKQKIMSELRKVHGNNAHSTMAATLMTSKMKDEHAQLLEKIYSPTRINQHFSELFSCIFTILFFATAGAMLLLIFTAELVNYQLFSYLVAHRSALKAVCVCLVFAFFCVFIWRLFQKSKTTTAFAGKWNISIRSAEIDDDLSKLLEALEKRRNNIDQP